MVACIVLSSPGAWAAVTACAATSAGALALSTYLTAADGCASVDVSFTNFTVSNATGTSSNGGNGNVPAVITTADINTYSTGTAATGTTTGPVNIFFVPGTVSQRDNWLLNGQGTQSQTGTINFQANAQTGGYLYRWHVLQPERPDLVVGL